jgi:hypothetical protein
LASKPNHSNIDRFKQFEIDSYKAEQELALAKYRAEAAYQDVVGSRTWRYTEPIRKLVSFTVRLMGRSWLGRTLSAFLQRILK